ncbi:hypothetical protein JCM3774_004883 [Rhodotorula dairenensis]
MYPSDRLSINLDVSKNALEKHALTTLTPTAAIDDVFSTDHFDSEKPISGGIFHVTPGDELLTYTYKYHELKYIISGTIILDEKNTGEKIVGEAGDVISIKAGSTITFSSPTPGGGKAFYVGQRKLRDF